LWDIVAEIDGGNVQDMQPGLWCDSGESYGEGPAEGLHLANGRPQADGRKISPALAR